jgi:hypothetical protein
MRTVPLAVLSVALMCNLSDAARAADDAKAIVDKGIKALGGEAKLAKAKGLSWRTSGTLTGKVEDATVTSTFTAKTTVAGLDRMRLENAAEVMGNTYRSATVLDGDKGWRRFGNMNHEIEKDDLEIEKRVLFLQVAVMTLLPIKGKDVQLEPAGEEKVGDSDAVGVKVTPSDGKDFTLFFDKSTGLPVKLLVKMTFQGEESLQETTYGSFRDFGGVKTATKIEVTHDGAKWFDADITEFKLLTEVDPSTFAEPK